MTRKTMIAVGFTAALVTIASTRHAPNRVTGFFSSLGRSASTGDLGGAEVFISMARVRDRRFATPGEDRYFAYVQLAEGSPAEPQLVQAQIRGDTVSFSLAGKYAAISPFVGIVSRDSLVGHFSNDWQVRLPRRTTYWQ